MNASSGHLSNGPGLCNRGNDFWSNHVRLCPQSCSLISASEHWLCQGYIIGSIAALAGQERGIEAPLWFAAVPGRIVDPCKLKGSSDSAHSRRSRRKDFHWFESFAKSNESVKTRRFLRVDRGGHSCLYTKDFFQLWAGQGSDEALPAPAACLGTF